MNNLLRVVKVTNGGDIDFGRVKSQHIEERSVEKGRTGIHEDN